MYLLFRYHGFMPSAVWNMPIGEKKVLHAFAIYEEEERRKEGKDNATY